MNVLVGSAGEIREDDALGRGEACPSHACAGCEAVLKWAVVNVCVAHPKTGKVRGLADHHSLESIGPSWK